AMGKGGELFVLNMGEPIKILDLARNLIMLAGLDPDKDMAIQFIGLKPGEKLFEELFRASDVRKDTGHPDIFMAVPEEADAALLRGQMRELKDLCSMPDPTPLLKRIKELVPAYDPNPHPDKKASKSS
ncbi:MAG: polysaccharide biosynthesis protein, partial [Candidatus Aminicenantes bacterium]|nr:polysaccharide biosynthesis protein [Candidatus Aminicenantes bacterium]